MQRWDDKVPALCYYVIRTWENVQVHILFSEYGGGKSLKHESGGNEI